MKSNRRTGMLGMALLMGGFLSAGAQAQDTDKPGEARDIRHVLLISVDGMHAVDFLNCSKGIAGSDGRRNTCLQSTRWSLES